jgi:hypothetical protein
MSPTSPDIDKTTGNRDAAAMKPQSEVAVTPMPLPDDGGATEQTLSISDLFRELQETNRLLRDMAAQKAADPATSPTLPSSLLTFASKSWSPRMGGGESHPLPTPEPDLVRDKARQYVEELAHAAFSSANKEDLEDFRDWTLKLVSRSEVRRGPSGRDGPKISPRDQVRMVVRLADSPASKASPPSELLWDWRSGTTKRKLPLTSQELDHLRQQWPVQFDLDELTQRFARGSGWILGKDTRLDGALCASPLFYGPGRNVLPADAILDVSQKGASMASMISASDLVSPGSLW